LVPRFLHVRPSRRALRLSLATVVTGGSILALAGPAFAAPSTFTPGDLVAYQVTEASGGPTSTAGTVALVDYGTNGTPSGFSVPMPIANSGSTHELVESGSATNDGDLTLSADGQYLYATGYEAAPNTASITSATSTPRTVAIVSNAGTVDTSTAFTDATTEAQNFRSATGPTGGTADFYNGGGAGVGYTADGATTDSFIDPGDKTHQVEIANGNLFESTTTDIFQLGTGLPTGTVTPTKVITTPPAGFSANGFAFVTLGSGTSPNTLYVADTANNAVEKYAYNGTTATLEGSVTVDDPTGLVASVNGSTASIYITNGSGTNSFATEISELTDSSGAGGTLPSATTVNLLATAGASSSFHGLAWAPSGPAAQTPESPVVVALPVLGLALLGGAFVVYRRRNRAGAGPLTIC
jgi:LPXTG-motif cell wall-anchored protein